MEDDGVSVNSGSALASRGIERREEEREEKNEKVKEADQEVRRQEYSRRLDSYLHSIPTGRVGPCIGGRSPSPSPSTLPPTSSPEESSSLAFPLRLYFRFHPLRVLFLLFLFVFPH